MKSINPYSNEIISSYDKMKDREVLSIIESMHSAFLKWKNYTFPEKSKLMRQAADILRKHKEEYAELITCEMGKPINESKAEIEKCALLCDYYQENAATFLEQQEIKTGYAKSYVRFDPIGIIFAVMPWNFPFWQVFRFAVPTLMAGNAGLLKHASNVSGCALVIDDIFKKAGFPENIFRALLIDHNQVDSVIAHSHIRAVTVTGSVEAGKTIAKRAGEFSKKSVLELGGSDAYIVLGNADIDKAAELCVKSRMINGGQSCIAAKRFIVHKSIHDKFVEQMKTKMQGYVTGDPMDKRTNLGPMVSKKQRDIIHEQVKQSVEKGAKCILGGEIEDKDGTFYPPTILINVKPDMPAYDDEIFGPVASVIKFNDVDEAINIANDSDFGLGGAIFSNDIKTAENIARQMDTGNVAINDYVKSDPRLPFGGVKYSGYGRELAKFGIREFVNIKTVVVA
ncbi:MAG: succinate-semialdehyde dehydrogenase [Alphaproteobacteria bacterium CG11_big_fil_rev_8_21_14_0_20_39_49]|nr:MAG: succinate-semialdehyde dehydrogenase [Alphaproteobacteria bacterium CG11_big_fil_rev_8_21_14_0_20_39_49]